MADELQYTLVEKINQTGMFDVYLGYSKGLDGSKRICTIKLIHPSYPISEEFIALWVEQDGMYKNLEHVNIVRPPCIEMLKGSYAAVGEFINGADLAKILISCENSGKSLPLPLAIYIAAEVASGLHFAHTQIHERSQKPLEFVHGEVSPHNIVVSFDGLAKITGFGLIHRIIKHADSRKNIVSDQYPYFSPEQILATQVDPRSDVFSLGVVLWEMVAMERLFQGNEPVAILQGIKEGKVRRIPLGKHTEGSEVDEELESIIFEALQKDRDKRFGDAEQFEMALRKYLKRRYPAFLPSDLGSFLQALLADQFLKSRQATETIIDSSM